MDKEHFFHIFAELARNTDIQQYTDVPGWVPEVYDMAESDAEELEFILKYASLAGSPVLEPACGSGRLLIPLARAGYDITGVDINKQMLNLLEKNLESESDSVRQRVTIEHRDMQTFSIDRKYNFVFLSANALYYVPTFEGQQETLANISRHMNPGGLLLVDVYLPKPNPCAEEPYMRTAKSADGKQFMFYLAQARDDYFTQTSHVNSVTFLYQDGMLKQTFLDSWQQRWIYPVELQLMLKLAGFQVEEMLGDYTADPLNEYSTQMVAIAKKI